MKARLGSEIDRLYYKIDALNTNKVNRKADNRLPRWKVEG
jgi:hypothetical protein